MTVCTFHLPVQTRAPRMSGLRRRLRTWRRRHELDRPYVQDQRGQASVWVSAVVAGMLAVVLGLVLGAGVAGASTFQNTPTAGTAVRATASLAPGTLAFVSSPPSISWAVAETGRSISDQAMVGGSEPIDVADATGSGAGWQVDLATTTFSTTTGHSLPATAATVQTAPSVLCDATDVGGCSIASNTAPYPYQVPAGVTPPTATVLASAAKTTGMGDQTLRVPFDLSVPAGAYAGQYHSVWTFTLATGPGSSSSGTTTTTTTGGSGSTTTPATLTGITDTCSANTTSATIGSTVTCTLATSGGTAPYTWTDTLFTGLSGLSLTATTATTSKAHIHGTLSAYGAMWVHAKASTTGSTALLVHFAG